MKMSAVQGGKPVIIVHGGASQTCPAVDDPLVASGIQKAAVEGYNALLAGSALDAVEKAVCCLEDNPRFNAGCGSKLNAEGEIEMDALIMDGKSLKSGAVACVMDVQNPVKLARCVMEKTESDFLIGKGLEAFIDEVGVPRVDRNVLLTDRRKEELQTLQEAGFASELSKATKAGGLGTVGAVAMDRHGNIACATSTGGLTGKRVGRVGDTPLIACGGYCDNEVGGVSTTGIGEGIMRVALAARVVLYMEQGMSCQAAATKALDFLKQRTSYVSGLIVVNASGEAAPVFSSPAMSWASIKEGRVSYGLRPGEVLDGGLILGLRSC